MTEQQLKDAFTSHWPFFGVSPHGDVLARYVPYGPVFRWSWNQMIPMPVQGSDLCWLLQAASEEGHAMAESTPAPAVKKTRKPKDSAA